MNWLKSWLDRRNTRWAAARKEEIRKATKADIDKEPIKAKELWAWAQTDPLSAAEYMAGMSYSAGADTHIKLTMRLIAELTSKNDNRTRKASRTTRALQPNPRTRRGSP